MSQEQRFSVYACMSTIWAKKEIIAYQKTLIALLLFDDPVMKQLNIAN
jgi:hypothetical protein